MIVRCVWEHNGNDTILYSDNFVGAFTRGASLQEAEQKMPEEIRRYQIWKGEIPFDDLKIEVVQEKQSDLQIKDADSDVLFITEKDPLSDDEYQKLKTLALKSAEDFLALYNSFPDKDKSVRPSRETFYGSVPRAAEEMYQHTKNVNGYYFSEIGVEADNEGTILSCRTRGFERLERMPGFLSMPVVEGSYDEQWSVRKVLRRFIWHDRIHAKAMYRMGIRTFGIDATPDVFGFNL